MAIHTPKTQATAGHPNFEFVRRSAIHPDFYLLKFLGTDMFAIGHAEPVGLEPLSILGDGFVVLRDGPAQVFILEDDKAADDDTFEPLVQDLEDETVRAMDSMVKL